MSSSGSQSRDDRATVSWSQTALGGGEQTGSATACPTGAGLAWLPPRSARPTCSLVGDLRAIAAAIDVAWRAALRGEGGCAFRLGEASHGVHRALIALEGYVADLETASS